jgi:hypothetical protein
MDLPPVFTLVCLRAAGLAVAAALIAALPGCARPSSSSGASPAATGAATTATNRTNPPRPPPVKPVTLAPTVLTNALRYPLITPLESVFGRVVSVNTQAQFVVVDFFFNRLPSPGQHLAVFRLGRRVGEVRASVWAKGGRMAADILNGDAQVGDDVRAEERTE